MAKNKTGDQGEKALKDPKEPSVKKEKVMLDDRIVFRVTSGIKKMIEIDAKNNGFASADLMARRIVMSHYGFTA